METIENNYRISQCPFCNSSDILKLGDLKYGDKVEFSTYSINLTLVPEIWKCLACKSAFTQNAIPPGKAESLYATGDGAKRWSPISFEEDKTDMLIYYVGKILDKKDIKLLDIGCNTGEFLDYAKQKGVKTFGLEICEQSIDILKRKGHRAFQSSTDIKEVFDVVTAFDVAEHLYNPNDFFSFAGSIMLTGGYLIIMTGNPESFHAKVSKQYWWYFNYPEHIVFPSLAYFKSISGFELKYYRKVYASKIHQKGNLLVKLKDAAGKLLAKEYAGLPALMPDHHLIILQKTVSLNMETIVN